MSLYRPARDLALGLELGTDEVPIVGAHGFWRRWMWITWFIVPALFVRRQRRNIDLVVTNRRVIYTGGVMRRSQHVIERAQITAVRVHRGPLASRLGYGDLVIESAGRPSPDVIRHIDSVRPIRDVVTWPTQILHVEGGFEDLAAPMPATRDSPVDSGEQVAGSNVS